MKITEEQLKTYFAVQLNRKITNLFFFTQEEHPRELDRWTLRVIPASDLWEIIPGLADYEYYRTTAHMPRFFRKRAKD